MAYRWKTQQPVAPMGGQTAYDAAQAAAAMNPAPQGAPVAVEPFQDINAQIRDNEAKLAAIESEIAQIDRQYPELKEGGQHWEIAAKRAEIGDFSDYDARRSYGRNVSESGAPSADKLEKLKISLPLLKGKDSVESQVFDREVQSELRKAEDWAYRTGRELPTSYFELKDEYESMKADIEGPKTGFYVDNAEEVTNRINSMVTNKTWNRNEERAAQKWVDEHPNDPAAKTLQQLINANKNNTVEAKREAEAKDAKWKKWFNKVVNSSNVAGEIRKLNDEEYKQFKRRFDYDEKKGELKRK